MDHHNIIPNGVGPPGGPPCGAPLPDKNWKPVERKLEFTIRNVSDVQSRIGSSGGDLVRVIPHLMPHYPRHEELEKCRLIAKFYAFGIGMIAAPIVLLKVQSVRLQRRARPAAYDVTHSRNVRQDTDIHQGWNHKRKPQQHYGIAGYMWLEHTCTQKLTGHFLLQAVAE